MKSKEKAKKKRKEYYEKNKERELKVNEKYRNNNKVKISKINHEYYKKRTEYYKDNAKKHYRENREKRLEQTRLNQNKRYREDEGFKMRKNLSGSLWKVIDHYVKTGRIGNPMAKYSIDWVGIIKQLSPIPKNRRKYQVDHIIPLYKFDLTNIEQIQIALAPENHRWLTKEKNQSRERPNTKGRKYKID